MGLNDINSITTYLIENKVPNQRQYKQTDLPKTEITQEIYNTEGSIALGTLLFQIHLQFLSLLFLHSTDKLDIINYKLLI